jgi:hypothetical protein
MMSMTMALDDSTQALEIVLPVAVRTPRIRRPKLARVGAPMLILGLLGIAAGCYRSAAELRPGMLRTLVPTGRHLPLAAEFLMLDGVVLCVAAVLLLGASLRRH